MFWATARRFNFLSIVRHKIKDSVPNSIKLKFLCFPFSCSKFSKLLFAEGTYLWIIAYVCCVYVQSFGDLLCIYKLHIHISADDFFRQDVLLKFLIILKQNFPIPWESIDKKTKIVSFPSTKTIYGPILLNVINGTFREIRMYVKMSTWNRMPVYAI